MGISSRAGAALEVSPCDMGRSRDDSQIAPHIRRDFMRLAGLQRDWLDEHRTGVHARVELATLAARIDGGRQVAQQQTIEFASGKPGIEPPRVDAREPRAKTAVDHLLCELGGRNAPDRKERLEPGACKLLFAVSANVLEKQVAERRVRKSLRLRVGNRRAHLRFVDVVWTWMRKVHDMQRQSS